MSKSLRAHKLGATRTQIDFRTGNEVDHLMILLMLMVDSGIPELSSLEDVAWVPQALMVATMPRPPRPSWGASTPRWTTGARGACTRSTAWCTRPSNVCWLSESCTSYCLSLEPELLQAHLQRPRGLGEHARVVVQYATHGFPNVAPVLAAVLRAIDDDASAEARELSGDCVARRC